MTSDSLPTEEKVSEKPSVEGALDMAARCRYLDNGPVRYDRTLYGAVWALADEVLRLRGSGDVREAHPPMKLDLACCICGHEEKAHHPYCPPPKADSDPDGECYRGGEYASALTEEQARIQRELK